MIKKKETQNGTLLNPDQNLTVFDRPWDWEGRRERSILETVSLVEER